MAGFEWVELPSSEDYREELESQAESYEELRRTAISYCRTTGSLLGLFGLGTIIKYFLSYYRQPPTSYSINISDAIVNRGSSEALFFSGVSMNFGMGYPNKALATFVGLIAASLVIEIATSAWRINRYSIKHPVEEDTGYQTLREIKQENQRILSKSRYLYQGMSRKLRLFPLLLLLSLYVLVVLSGQAIGGDLVNPGYQIILLDLLIIGFTLSAFMYLLWELFGVLHDTLQEAKIRKPVAFLTEFRGRLRSDYNGVFGSLSGFTVYLTFLFINYSGLPWHLWDIIELWSYYHP